MKTDWSNSVSSPMFAADGQSLNVPLLEPLFADVVEFDRLLRENDSQFARRGYVRAGFALIEGQLYWFKNIVQQWLIGELHRKSTLNITALALFDDQAYFIQANGSLQPTAQRQPFRNYCAFVLRTACQLAECDPDKLFSDNGWNELKKALEVRHRLTHPKNVAELFVGDREIFCMREGHRWLFNSFVEIVTRLDVEQK